MLLVVNAVLYLVALTLSLCVLTPVPEGATRRARVARMSLACGGGATITAAIALTFAGMWVESAVVGCIAAIVVCVCLWVAMRQSSQERDDGEDGSDGGGGRPRRPVPPAPPEPLGGPPADWSDFDAARAGWAREHAPAAGRELVGV